ncbi:MAG: AAA family ATPase [Candidatus Aenigmatarchaeota archaeon]
MLQNRDEEWKEKVKPLLYYWKNLVLEKNVCEDGNYDFTEDSIWSKRVEIVKNLVEELRKDIDEKDIGDKLRYLLSRRNVKYKDKDWLVFFGGTCSILGTLLDKGYIEELKQIIFDIERLKEKKDLSKILEKVYNLIEQVKGKGVNAKNYATKRILELYSILHPDKIPIFNACSRNILSDILNEEIDNNDFENFSKKFEKFKEFYLDYVGKISGQHLTIYHEIDMMFNYFDKNEKGKKFFEKWKNSIDIRNASITASLENKLSKTQLPLNIIIYGPSGTGKTYATKAVIVKIERSEDFTKLCDDAEELKKFSNYEKVKKEYENIKNEGRIEFVTFHPSYSYEDFVEGITAKIDGGQVTYVIKPGILKNIVDKAKKERDKKFYLIIDEINRGNIPKIFGELITLIEEDKRESNENEIILKLTYSQENFSIPPNLYIIGTMNTADKSIALIDIALRRRFEFFEMVPDARILEGKSIKGVNLKELLEALNKRIIEKGERDKQIGHSYFMGVETEEDLRRVWFRKILPLINEYFYGRWDDIKDILSEDFLKEITKEEDIWDFKKENELNDNKNFIECLKNLIKKTSNE